MSTTISGSAVTTSLVTADDITVDTDTLTVDTTNDRVGINVASPTQALDVSGTVKATSFSGDGSGLSAVPVSGLFRPNDAANLTKTTITANLGTNSLSSTTLGYSATKNRIVWGMVIAYWATGVAYGGRLKMSIDGGWNNFAIGSTHSTTADNDWMSENTPPLYPVHSIRYGNMSYVSNSVPSDNHHGFLQTSTKDGTDTDCLDVTLSTASAAKHARVTFVAYVEAGGKLKISASRNTNGGLLAPTVHLLTMDLD